MQTFRMTALAASALAAAAILASGAASAKDGVYTADSLGRNGIVMVQTMIENGRIAGVKILDWSKTHPIADLPREHIPADIVK